MPTLNLNASSEFSNIYKRKGPSSEKSYHWENSVSIKLDIPLYQGCLTHSKVKQSQHNFVRFSETLVSKNEQYLKNFSLRLIIFRLPSVVLMIINQLLFLKKVH